MTAGEAPADDGNGSPAMGPEKEGEIKITHVHIRAGGERVGVPESSAVKGTRAGIGFLPLKVEKSPGDLSQV